MSDLLAKFSLRANAARAAKAKPLTPEAALASVVLAKDGLERKMAVKQAGQMQSHEFFEIRRICDLMVVHPMSDEEREQYCRANILAPAYDHGFRFLPEQAEAICAYELYGGLFGPIGVGQGKTLAKLCIAAKAYAKGLRRIVLFDPPNTMPQLLDYDIKWARMRVPINYPINVLAGRDADDRRALAKSKKNGLYIFPYSLLSAKDAEENLREIAPQLIIGDEAHNLANPRSARGQRVNRYLKENPKTECVWLSGTVTHKSLRDYRHLLIAALKTGAPIPLSAVMAEEWATVLDATAGSEGGSAGPVLPLVNWARERFPGQRHGLGDDVSGFRRAFKLRLTTTPGVVASGDAMIGTSLVIANKPVESPEKIAGWKRLCDYRDAVEFEWKTPDGDELEHAIHKFKWHYELSVGFYNSLVWPSPAQLMERGRAKTAAEADQILTACFKHHEAGQLYARALRKWIEAEAKPGLDSPMLVGSNMHQHGDRDVGTALYDLWRDWKGLDFENRPERDRIPVRVCPYKINAVVEWAKSIKGGAIIWYYHQEIGKWINEALLIAGLPNVMHCPAGPKWNSVILDPGHADKIVVASMEAHGTGKNLQHFSQQYFFQWPRPAVDAEQTIGRTHRTGQKADELIVNTNLTLDFDQMLLAACINDALYIQQTTSVRQKLVFATYNPVPPIFPGAVLREKGFETKPLTAEQERELKEKFGEAR